MILATVLRTGGHYDTSWVRRLERASYQLIKDHHQFVCLTDVPKAELEPFVRVIPLEHDWPGWWSKLELFKPGVFPEGEAVLYLDLDTLIVRHFEFLWGAIDCDLLMLRDFYRPRGLASGIMGWQAGRFTDLYELFSRNPEAFMARHRRGDQDYMEGRVDRSQVRCWQEEFPDRIVSYKVHCKKGGLPGKAHVVCFHGKPRPDQVRDDWVMKLWHRT